MTTNEKIYTVKIDIPVSIEVGASSEDEAAEAVEEMLKILTMNEGRGESRADLDKIKFLRKEMGTAMITSVKSWVRNWSGYVKLANQ